MNRGSFLVLPLACLVMGLAAGSEPYFESQLLFPLQEKHVHSSSIVECRNGDLLACWFEGSGERRSMDVVILGSRRRQGEAEWSAPFLMADTPEFPDCNPVLFIDDRDELWLFWIAVLAERWEDSLLRCRRSQDYLGDGPPKWHWQDLIVFDPGERFEAAISEGFDRLEEQLPDMPMDGFKRHLAKRDLKRIREESRNLSLRQRGWMTRSRPLILPSGRYVLPLYSDGSLLGLMAISDDRGETWRASAPVVGLALNQPSLARKADGTLVAYMREEDEYLRRILRSESADDGETWSLAVPTDMPNPNASVEALTLRDGRWLLLYNDSETVRDTLVLALSDDEGDTWSKQRHMESEPGGQFHYPSMIAGQDGRVHITYTFQPAGNMGKSIKHVVLEPDWVSAGAVEPEE